jgi:hypothetical protein
MKEMIIMADNMEEIFQRLNAVILAQQQLINSIADKVEKIESIGGGGGTASIEDYVSDKDYKRNVLLVDTNTETVYRVIEDYHSVTVTDDCEAGKLKLIGFESQVVTFSHRPTQDEIDALPEDTLVAIYDPTSDPYEPALAGD